MTYPAARTPPAAAVSSTTTSGTAAALAYARAQVGKPYVWGAAGPGAFDCSGLTMMAWRAGGVSLPHEAHLQRACGVSVPQTALQPGDLVFPYATLSHVQLYVGNGNVIEAANPREGVVGPRPLWGFAGGACRVSGASTGPAADTSTGSTSTTTAGFFSGAPADVWAALKPVVFYGGALAGGCGLIVAGLSRAGKA